jgi:nucleoid DNA-binding protein
MGNSDLIRDISVLSAMSKQQVEAVLDSFKVVLRKELGKDNGELVFLGLIKFKRVTQKARPAKEKPSPKNPCEIMRIPARPARPTVKVKALKALLSMV